MNCALAPDPKGVVDAVLDSARTGNGPGGASVAAVTHAIVSTLGYPIGDRVSSTNELARALAGAHAGDANLLNNLINRAQGTVGSDGHFINSCADALNRPTPTGSGSCWSPGARSTRSSAPSAPSIWRSA